MAWDQVMSLLLEFLDQHLDTQFYLITHCEWFDKHAPRRYLNIPTAWRPRSGSSPEWRLVPPIGPTSARAYFAVQLSDSNKILKL